MATLRVRRSHVTLLAQSGERCHVRAALRSYNMTPPVLLSYITHYVTALLIYCIMRVPLLCYEIVMYILISESLSAEIKRMILFTWSINFLDESERFLSDNLHSLFSSLKFKRHLKSQDHNRHPVVTQRPRYQTNRHSLILYTTFHLSDCYGVINWIGIRGEYIISLEI